MIASAGLYAELYPWLHRTVLAWHDFGKKGLPDALGVSPWLVVLIRGNGIETCAKFNRKSKGRLR
jgi:hypothetical protein